MDCLVWSIGAIISLIAIALLSCKQKKTLAGKAVLVTGGASGIGREIAFSLAEKGCNVVIADINAELLEKTINELKKIFDHLKFFGFKVDVGNYTEIVQLRLDIESKLGPIDIVINNAAIIFEPAFDDDNHEKFERVIRVNVLSLLWTTKVFLPSMIARKQGHIVSLASIAGLFGSPKMITYGTTKFAVRGFMENLQNELFLEGHSKFIDLTTVFPAFVNSNEDIKSFVSGLVKVPKVFKMLNTKKVANRVVEGIERNERIVVIPGIAKLFGYYITVPVFLKHLGFKLLLKGVK